MLWKGGRQSGNIEDMRGSGGGGRLIGGGLGALAIAVIAMLFGKDPSAILGQLQGNAPAEQAQTAPGQPDEGKAFVAVVLGDTEDVWHKLFSNLGKNYTEPKLVLFSGGVQSGCGNASAATGPFYCPLDSKVYLDLTFFSELKNRFQVAGDFANAYVIAHEVGHHVQNLLGTSDKVHDLQQRVSETEANQLSVKLELQADFYAGVWAHHAQKMRNVIEEGDIDEALNAANAIGDDKLQMQAQGYVVPDAFTHGTSAQRKAWFKKGYETGDMSQGDTFAGNL